MRFLKHYIKNTWGLLLFSLLVIIPFLVKGVDITLFLWILLGVNLFAVIGRYVEFKREKIVTEDLDGEIWIDI